MLSLCKTVSAVVLAGSLALVGCAAEDDGPMSWDQFRANAYNFLNHPLWSFNNTNLNLGFNGTTGQLSTPLFGYVNTKQGRRIVQLAATFTF